MQWLGQPARLFTLATMLIALPEVLHSTQRLPPPNVIAGLAPSLPAAGANVFSSRIVTLKADGQPTVVHGDKTKAPLFYVSHGLPLPLRSILLASFPIFAVCYVVLPRMLRRPLDARLGRRHFMLAVIPTIVLPLVGILHFFALSLVLPLLIDDGHALLTTYQAILTVFAGIALLPSLLWTAGLIVFGINIPQHASPAGPGALTLDRNLIGVTSIAR